MMLTTHYMEEADLLADRVAIMDHGAILALDTPDSLKRSIGADSIVRVLADGDLQHLADALACPDPLPDCVGRGDHSPYHGRAAAGGRPSEMPRPHV